MHIPVLDLKTIRALIIIRIKWIRDLSLHAHNLSIISILKYSLMQYNDRYTLIEQSPLYIVISCHAVAIAIYSCNKLHGLNGCLIILDLHGCNIISY